jgi:hypothetical protein
MKTIILQVADDFTITKAGAMVLVSEDNAREAQNIGWFDSIGWSGSKEILVDGQPVNLYAVKDREN